MPPARRPLMIFAAGFGTRMGALTADRPKPLVEVAGRPLIDHALDLAEAAGMGPVAVNLHYRGEMLARHLAGRDLRLSWERGRLLDTGGGLRAALPLLGPGPVATLNSDAVWTGPNPLAALVAAWDGARMEGLVMLVPRERATGHAGGGDFVLDAEGRVARAAGGPGLVYSGAQILHPAGLAAIAAEVFSLNLLWDRMIARGRLYGIVHPGGWCDVGHPGAIAPAEALLAGAR